MSALALSVLLALVSAVAYAGGAILQERVAATSEHVYAPVRRPGWWVAVGLNSLGATLHVAALAFGPLSLVQPLGALTIVFALPMAALFVGRRTGRTAWRGAVMATVGLAGLLALASGSGAHTLPDGDRLMLALATFGAVAALMLTGQAAYRHPVLRSVLLAGAAGVAFGMASVFTKTVATDLSSALTLGALPVLAVIAVLAIGGLLLSQASYRGAGLAVPLTVVTVVNPVAAAVIGLTLFGETFRYGLVGGLFALLSAGLAAGGLGLLAHARTGRRGPVAMPMTASTPNPAVAGTAGLVDGRTPGLAGLEAALLDTLAPLDAPRLTPQDSPAPLARVEGMSPGGPGQIPGGPGQILTPPARR